MDEQPTTTEQPENGNANGGGAGQGGSPQQATFTQEQLDAIIAERLKRSKETTTSELLGQLGVDNLEAATKAIKEAEAAKKAQMSELEQAQAERDEALQAVAKAEAEAKAVRATAEEALLRAAIVSAASEFNDPNDAWLYVDRSKIETEKDGTYKGVDDAIKAVVEARPYLLKQGEQPLGTPNRRNRGKTQQAWQNRQEQAQPEQAPRKPVVNF